MISYSFRVTLAQLRQTHSSHLPQFNALSTFTLRFFLHWLHKHLFLLGVFPLSLLFGVLLAVSGGDCEVPLPLLFVVLPVVSSGNLELFSPKRAYSHISQNIRSPLQFTISFFLFLFGQSFPGGPAQAPILYFVMRDAWCVNYRPRSSLMLEIPVDVPSLVYNFKLRWVYVYYTLNWYVYIFTSHTYWSSVVDWNSVSDHVVVVAQSSSSSSYVLNSKWICLKCKFSSSTQRCWAMAPSSCRPHLETLAYKSKRYKYSMIWINLSVHSIIGTCRALYISTFISNGIKVLIYI